jgi:PAS domain S-box-containing protein
MVVELIQLRKIVYWAPTPLVLFGLDRTIQFFNPAFTRVYGWSLEELRGKTFPVPEAERDQWHALLKSVQSGGSFLNVPTKRLRKDGSEVRVVISGAPVTDDAGNPAAIVGLALEAEPRPEVLLERARLEFLVQHSSEFICVTDLSNRILFINHAGGEMVGVCGEDVLHGTSAFELFRSEDHAVLRNKLLPLALEDESFQTRLHLKNRTLQGQVPVYGSVHILRNSISQVPEFFVYSFQNISDVIRSEARQRRSEQALRILSDSARTPIAYISAEGQPFDSNERFCRLSGYGADELRQMLFPDLIHPDDRGKCRERFLELMSGRLERYKVTVRLRKKNGEVIWGRMAFFLVRGDSGEPSYSIAILEPANLRDHRDEDGESLDAE